MSSPTLTGADVDRPSASTDSITLHEASDKASTLVQPKDKSSLRRWINVVRRVVFSESARKQSETSSGKRSEESLVQTPPPLLSSSVIRGPHGALKEDMAGIEPTSKVESAAVLGHVARNQQASSVPASLASDLTSAPTRVGWCMTALEQATAAQTLLSNSMELNDDQAISAKPAKAKCSRKPRGPTMITPAMLEKLAKDNKKHQGATAVREAEVRKSSRGAASSTSCARGVQQASPMRWSHD